MGRNWSAVVKLSEGQESDKKKNIKGKISTRQSEKEAKNKKK